MKTLIRNFTHTFRRFFTASVLNIMGLAIAFASFFVIMTQVDYDLNFNKGYKDYEKIFRLEINISEEMEWLLGASPSWRTDRQRFAACAGIFHNIRMVW